MDRVGAQLLSIVLFASAIAAERASAQEAPEIIETVAEAEGLPEVTTDPAAEVPRRPEQLDPAAPLTLRPEASLRSLAERVARTLVLRAQLEVSVGAEPPPEIVEAVPSGHVGLVREGPELLVVLGGPVGLIYASRVDLPSSRTASIRAVALAIEALRDAAIEGPPPAPEVEPDGEGPGAAPGQRVSYVYIEREGGLFGVRRRQEPNAHPTIYLRALLGFSTARSTALVGPGIGLGLCLDMSCVVIEGDLPVIPEERWATDGLRMTKIQYRPISFGLRFALRPWRLGDFVPGLVFGILTRFGNAWIEADPMTGVGAISQTVTDFGLRASLEVAWIFAAPFELVFELGVDFIANPAAFVRRGPGGSETVLLEDVVTLWGVTSVRLRP